MSTFTLDTSGEVTWWEYLPRVNRRAGPYIKRWPDLDPFTQGYVEAMFAEWKVTAKGKAFTEDGPLLATTWEGPPPILDAARGIIRSPRFSDLAPETLTRIIEDCAKAQRDVPTERDRDHGEYFWRACALAGTTPYLGDDGKVCLRDAA